MTPERVVVCPRCGNAAFFDGIAHTTWAWACPGCSTWWALPVPLARVALARIPAQVLP